MILLSLIKGEYAMSSKNFRRFIILLIKSVIILSVFTFTACGGGGGGGGGEETPDYTNPNLPLTETQDWLIMYYCDADNDLEEYLMKDLNEMESVDLSSKKIKIVALVDRNASYWTGGGNWSDTRAYEIKYDSGGYNTTVVSERVAIEDLGISRNLSSAEVNMGSGATLTSFIEFCVTNYPATKKMLLLSNHGGGWRDNPAAKKKRLDRIGVTKAVCWDETNGDACLYTSELKTAISAALGSDKLDIIAFDACLMGMVEVAYELKDVAYYMVASEETIPGYGFPYTQILNALPSDLSSYSPDTFGTSIVDQYYNAYHNGTNVEDPGETDESVTLALIDLSQIPALTTAINNLGSALDAANGSNANMDKRIISESFEVSDYVDIKDYCAKETLCSTERSVVTTAFNNAVIYYKAGSSNSDAYGLSIFMPLIWTGSGEQADYTSSNIQFVNTGAAPDWRTYLTSLTATTATDQNEIEESANGGGIYTTVPAVETGYIYYSGDMDIYAITSDGTFNISYTYGGSGYVIVDIYIYKKTTLELVANPFMTSPGNLDISYNVSTCAVEIYVYGTTYSTTQPYILTFTNN